jgi:hypothetical protein
MASTSKVKSAPKAPQKRGSAKAGISSGPLSWARKYKTILRNNVSDWLNTNTPAEELQVINKTVESIQAEHKGDQDPDPLPDNLQEVISFGSSGLSD